MFLNLSLFILRYMIVKASIGEGAIVALSDYRKENRIPNSTFHRHVSSLMNQGFVDRVGRDKYILNPEFIENVIHASRQLPLPIMPKSKQWGGYPF